MDLSDSRFLRTTLHAAQKAKEKGNDLLKYTRGNALLLETKELDLSEHPKALSLFVANNLNLALAHLKLKQYDECVLFCDNVLHQEPNNVKALYRKGEALLAAGHRRDAVALFKQVIKVEPTNKAARQYVIRFKEPDLDSLQDGIMKHLCHFLGPKDILSMRRVSKKLKRSMDAASMQILEGVARSRNLSISRSAKGKWSFEREVYGKGRKSIIVSDSSLDLLITVISLSEPHNEDGDFTTAMLSLDGAAAMNDTICSLLLSLKSIRPVAVNFVGDLSVLHRACVKQFADAWGYSNDIVNDEILTSIHPYFFSIRPHKALNPKQWPMLDWITDAVFEHFFSCARDATYFGRHGSDRPQYDLFGCTKLTVEGLRSALKRFATRGKSVDMKLRYCANFPDIYTVTKQLGDLGQARLEIMDSFNALYYYGTQFEPSYVIIVSVEGHRIQELQRNDPRNVASAMSMFRR